MTFEQLDDARKPRGTNMYMMRLNLVSKLFLEECQQFLKTGGQSKPPGPETPAWKIMVGLHGSICGMPVIGLAETLSHRNEWKRAHTKVDFHKRKLELIASLESCMDREVEAIRQEIRAAISETHKEEDRKKHDIKHRFDRTKAEIRGPSPTGHGLGKALSKTKSAYQKVAQTPAVYRLDNQRTKLEKENEATYKNKRTALEQRMAPQEKREGARMGPLHRLSQWPLLQPRKVRRPTTPGSFWLLRQSFSLPGRAHWTQGIGGKERQITTIATPDLLRGNVKQ